MATRQQFLARAKSLGVEVDEGSGDIEVLCPQGKVFAGVGTHMLRLSPGAIGWGGTRWTRPEIYKAMVEDLAAGLDDCSTFECDYCTEEEA